MLTFPQGVQAVEHEVVDGAADDAVVQRGRAAPSGQHRRELSKGRAGQASVGPCPGQGRGCRRASPPTCLLPTETRERASLAPCPCFLHLQLSLVLPLIPLGQAPSAPYMSPTISTGSRPPGSVVPCDGKVCTSQQATFLKNTSSSTSTQAGAVHSPLDVVPCPEISNTRIIYIKEGQAKGGDTSKGKQGDSN